MNNKKSSRCYACTFEKLGASWINRISKGGITVSEAAELSGFTSRYIYYKLKEGHIKSLASKTTAINVHSFIKWLSGLDVLPDSVLGKSTYSLRGLMNRSGRSRAWVLKHADIYQISPVYIGLHRRFDKALSDEMCDSELKKCRKWLTKSEVKKAYAIEEKELLLLVARHTVRTRGYGYNALFCKSDIVNELMWREAHV